jgi:hypothetical protein
MFKSLALCVVFAATPLLAADTNGAIAALKALPEKYRAGVLKLSADNASPDPETWYVSAKAAPDNKSTHSLEIAAGQIISDKPSIGLREIFSSANPIDLSKVLIDSRDAFGIAQGYAKASGKLIASVSFVLNQQGSAAVPVWSVWCYAPDGTYFGEMQLLATDGAVISNNAFQKNP